MGLGDAGLVCMRVAAPVHMHTNASRPEARTRSMHETFSKGMSGQSSSRGTWCAPKTCHSTRSLSTSGLFVWCLFGDDVVEWGGWIWWWEGKRRARRVCAWGVLVFVVVGSMGRVRTFINNHPPPPPKTHRFWLA